MRHLFITTRTYKIILILKTLRTTIRMSTRHQCYIYRIFITQHTIIHLFNRTCQNTVLILHHHLRIILIMLLVIFTIPLLFFLPFLILFHFFILLLLVTLLSIFLSLKILSISQYIIIIC